MALVNPSIAMSFRGPDIQPRNVLADYAAIQQIQGGQQAQELNALKMQEARAAMEERNALRQLNPAAEDYESQLFKVSPQLGIQYRKERTAADTAALTQQETAFKVQEAKRKFITQAQRDTSQNPSDANITAYKEDLMANPLFTETEKRQLAAGSDRLLAMPIGERIAFLSSQGATVSELRPTVVSPGASVFQGGRSVFTAPVAPAAPVLPLPPEVEAQRARIAAAGRAPAAPRPEQAPVAVVDPATGKPVLVSREAAISGRMTPAAAQESLPPKEIQKREAVLPQATSAVKSFETKSESFVTDLQRLRDHPGLAQITGIAAGRLPGLTAEGRAAQALYDKVVAKGGFQALQDLRDASKTGGALGNVSNQEGKQLTASFSAIDRRQDAADVRAAIDDAIGSVQGARTRMREAYDATYSYKTGGSGGGGGGALSPSEQAELDQLRKRFGGK